MLCSRLVRRALASPAATTTVRDLPAFFSLRPPKLYNSEWDACFSSQSQGREPDAGAILQNIQAQKFLRDLKQLQRHQKVMSFSELVQGYMKSTGVTDADEASRNCAALSTAGLILKHGDLVYLEPGEVALAVLGALPQQPQLLRAKLEETRRELAVLEDRRRHIERSVARKHHLARWGGLAFLTLPWAILFRLTYWELSWDVVEPIGFFLTGLTTILSYLWYMHHRAEFTWSEMHQRMISGWEQQAFKRANFDVARYEQLRRAAERQEQALRLTTPTQPLSPHAEPP
ncbi:hypothetical protein ACKKBG_A30975 [Auxenochlorella protothecoides x Auxenochlorella symbiontica]